jgi:hypothetical protein
MGEPTLDRYLEAMAAWIAASDQYYLNAGQLRPEGVNWRLLAAMLAAARIYE